MEDFEQYFGLAKVDILPPADLFHPVLPVRIGEKLTFPLCGQCVKEQQREARTSDDLGVQLMEALYTAIRGQLASDDCSTAPPVSKITGPMGGATPTGRQAHAQLILRQEDDRIFLAMTPQGFEHTYQTVAFPVHEFVMGSTRLDELMHKLAGKLNSNQSFQPNQEPWFTRW